MENVVPEGCVELSTNSRTKRNVVLDAVSFAAPRHSARDDEK